jgi:hypothetical protein
MDERLRLVARLLDGEAMTESVTISGKNRPRGFPDFALSSTVPAALKARHRKPSHFGSYCHGPSKSGSVFGGPRIHWRKVERQAEIGLSG